MGVKSRLLGPNYQSKLSLYNQELCWKYAPKKVDGWFALEVKILIQV